MTTEVINHQTGAVGIIGTDGEFVAKCDCGYQPQNGPDFYNHQHEKHPNPDTDPDWEGECEVCGASPIVPVTGLCGPCTFGEADTIGGNW